jgi:brefeldin A-inhibited guanine nucleotide-exchange protein
MTAPQKKEVLLTVSEEIATRSEAAFKGMANNKSQNRTGVAGHPFHVAQHTEHVRSMFNISWMPILAGISAPMQEAESSDLQTTTLCLMAFRSAIHLAAVFDLDLERNALLSTLTKYAYMTSITDLLFKPKNVESIRVLLEIGHADGNWLRGSWLDILRCVSSLERWMSMIGKNGSQDFLPTDASGVIPGVAVGLGGDGGVVPTVISIGGENDKRKMEKRKPELVLTKEDEAQLAANAQAILVSMDRIFTSSTRLTGVSFASYTGIISCSRLLLWNL